MSSRLATMQLQARHRGTRGLVWEHGTTMSACLRCQRTDNTWQALTTIHISAGQTELPALPCRLCISGYPNDDIHQQVSCRRQRIAKVWIARRPDVENGG